MKPIIALIQSATETTSGVIENMRDTSAQIAAVILRCWRVLRTRAMRKSVVRIRTTVGAGAESRKKLA